MDLNGLRILVTGSEGFVGRKLSDKLETLGAAVIKVDKTTGTDVRSWQMMRNYTDIDIIYHLAAMLYVPYAIENPRITYEVNIGGTLNIAELARREKAKVIFSSTYVYGAPQFLPVNEQHSIKPINPYSRSKLLAEGILEAYYKDFSVPVTILRPFNIFGPGQTDGFLIPTIINQLESGIVKLRNPTPKRDYVYIDDFIEACIKAVDSSDDLNIINIGSGRSLSVKNAVDTILKYYDKNVIVQYNDPNHINGIPDCYADVSRAKEILGWKPKIDFETGVQMILNQNR